MVLSYNRRSSFAIFIISIVILEMVLISDHIKPTNGLLKKKLEKILDDLVSAISLINLLKPKKIKLIPLPIPIPL